ncbi:MAG TPA: SDR family oxidoreductase [Ktedonobacteraceae bacterium]|jgi:NAD(P)-dependent dehydrogenase (short-subunit alcohol dehydrogenase family)|nr:SDR family oxidoreductase [Ktedonobacteraceae bacterium]
MNLQLNNKRAFISGSTQGIGYTIAKSLLEEGASVVLNGRSQDKLDRVVKKLKQKFPEANISGIAADFNDSKQIEELLLKLSDIDILINNVGLFELKPFEEITDDDWKRYFEVNVMSGVKLSRHILPIMLSKKWGRIIFISSESGVNIPENMIHYGTTKTAMLSLSNGLAKLTKGSDVTVNTIVGGPTYSDSVAQTIEEIAKLQNLSVEEMKSSIIGSNPTSLLQRFIEPSEIANLAVYLSSPLSSATNGSALRADGGVLTTIL